MNLSPFVCEKKKSETGLCASGGNAHKGRMFEAIDPHPVDIVQRGGVVLVLRIFF